MAGIAAGNYARQEVIAPAIAITAISALNYRESDPADVAGSATHDAGAITLDIAGPTANPIEPGTLLFAFAGDLYFDRDGTLYRARDLGTNAATGAGTVDYAGRSVTITGWDQAAPAYDALALGVRLLPRHIHTFTTRAAANRLRSASVQIVATRVSDSTQLTATSDVAGVISNVLGTIQGTVDYETALIDAQFYEDDGTTPAQVEAASLRYNAVAQSSLPIDPVLLGLDPVRLPLDGRVPMFRPGDVACVHHTGEDPLPDPFAPNDVHTLPFDRLTWARVKDADGTYVDTVHYTADLPAGTITAAPTADFSGHTLPLVAEFRIEDIAVVTDAELGGQVKMSKPITHEFPVPGSYISGVLQAGDMQARAFGLFDQETWTGVFSDTLIGDAVGDANYNAQLFPIEVSNIGTVKDRWALIFTNANTYNIVGEISGTVGTGTVLQDAEPENPATGQPYFTIRAAGWGAGWAQGNVVRFNTDGANAPVWCALTVMPSDPAPGDIDFKIEFRGNAD